MLGVNYVKVGSVAVVQCGEAIVWSGEHFYLVAALRGGEISMENIRAQINKH